MILGGGTTAITRRCLPSRPFRTLASSHAHGTSPTGGVHGPQPHYHVPAKPRRAYREAPEDIPPPKEARLTHQTRPYQGSI